MPLNTLQQWLQQEIDQGAPASHYAVLATAGEDGVPHSRVVAVREITETILFFSQKGTCKVRDILTNPKVSMTFWLELQQRSVVVDGEVEILTQEENEQYWLKMPRDRQLRFSATHLLLQK